MGSAVQVRPPRQFKIPTPRHATLDREVPSPDMPVRTVVERGPKGKKAVAFAVDWPGWSRGAKTPELALAALESYRPRYQPIARAAGMADEFDAAGSLKVIDDRVGTGTTDFCGIYYSQSNSSQ